MNPPPKPDFVHEALSDEDKGPFNPDAFDRDPFGNPEQQLRDSIAPGTIGDPNDDINDFPLIRDAGEKPRAKARSEEPPPAESPNDYGFTDTFSKKQTAIIRPTPFKYRPAIEIPKRAWLYGRHYLRGCVTATIAPPGWTKSTRSLTELIAMALCRPLLGEMPTTDQPLRCWYWSGEDEREEIERRIAALCQHHNIDARELEGRLFYDSANELPIKIANMTRGGLVFDEATIQQITDAIRRDELDAAVFDPFISVHTVPEGDNVSIDQVVKTFGKIAVDTNCAIDLDHHTRKLAFGQTEVSVEDARGASAIIGAVRSSRVINRMTAKEATDVGLSEVERLSYFRIGRAKANRAPPEASTWARMRSVLLANSDNVGALEAWEYPDAFDGVMTADISAIRELVSKNEYRADSRANDWIGRPIADRLNLNIDDQAHAGKIKRIIKAWIKNGVLAVETREDDERHKRKYIVPGQFKDAVTDEIFNASV